MLRSCNIARGGQGVTGTLIDQVAELVRRIAAEEVAPRFAALQPEEISCKDGDELVTIVDRKVEDRLTHALPALLPGSRVVGEEACAVRPDLLDRLGEGTAWLVDPIDGTRNLAEGRAPFAVMVALLTGGELAASWIHDPLTGRMCIAERGGGAWLDGQRLGPSLTLAVAEAEGIISRAFLPADRQAAADRLAAAAKAAHPTARCAGHEYPLVATGAMQFALYWRTLPWDHAAGTLLLRESGGSVTHLDGSDYEPVRARPEILLAGSPEMADDLLRVLGEDMPA
jgi:fructose-1,6-bisphosphatase/inositol monophosphatase family enzyme